jgi:hypothetical protein
MTPNRKISLLKNIFLIVFLSLIGLNFIIYSFFKSRGTIDRYSKREKTEFPENHPKVYKNYFTQIENYLSDKFLLKYYYITNINTLRYKIFNFSNSAKKVIFGKDDWMFYNAYHFDDIGGMDGFCGLKPWSDDELNTTLKNIHTIKKWCLNNGIEFVFLVCPNKQSIYPEKLPDVYKQYGPNHYDQLMEADTTLINLKKVLLSKKKNIPFPLYYSADSHWNWLGGFLGSAEISKVLHHTFSFIPELKYTDVIISEKDNSEDCDLAFMAALKDTTQGINVFAYINKQATKKLRKLFIVHDSYYRCIQPAMTRLFDTIKERLWYISDVTPKEVLENKPDVFIYEVCERFEDKLLITNTEGFK